MKTRFGRIALELLASVALTATACGGGGDSGPAEGAGDDGGQDVATQPAGSAETRAGNDTSTGNTPETGEETIDACALIPVEKINEALGATMEQPHHDDLPRAPFFGCRYESGSGPMLTVSVVIYRDADEAELSISLVAGTKDHETVLGIGDEAYNTQPIGDITVRRGKYELGVHVYGYSEDDEEELNVAKELARAALGNLP